MTQAEKKEALKWMEQQVKKVREDLLNIRRYNVYRGQDGWNSPPAVLPRSGEIAMGIHFDPEWNTR